MKTSVSKSAAYRWVVIHPSIPVIYSRDQQTMALRRPPTRIELKADDVEEYDKVSNGQQWFIILLALHKSTYMLCIPY